MLALKDSFHHARGIIHGLESCPGHAVVSCMRMQESCLISHCSDPTLLDLPEVLFCARTQLSFLPADPLGERERRECRTECSVCCPGSPTRHYGRGAPFMTESQHALTKAGWVHRKVALCCIDSKLPITRAISSCQMPRAIMKGEGVLLHVTFPALKHYDA
jgi:hypothetical protein